MNLRNAFTKKPRTVETTSRELVANQESKNETDINTITDRHLGHAGGGLHGVASGTGRKGARPRQAMFGDFSSSGDFQSAVNGINDAEFAFSQLPGRLRARFKNSAYQLMRFLEDPANLAEAIKLGLVEEPATEPVKAPEKASETAPKADPEANPDFKKSKDPSPS